MSSEELDKSIDKTMDEIMNKHNYKGFVLLLENENGRFTQAYSRLNSSNLLEASKFLKNLYE